MATFTYPLSAFLSSLPNLAAIFENTQESSKGDAAASPGPSQANAKVRISNPPKPSISKQPKNKNKLDSCTFQSPFSSFQLTCSPPLVAGFIIIRMGNAEPNLVPVRNFERALECGGSFLSQFSIANNTSEGKEGRDLLMTFLEPLLGGKVEFGQFMGALNSYRQSRRFKEGEGLCEDSRRFVEEVTKNWKK